MAETSKMYDADYGRLLGCFKQVFPDLSESAIPASTQNTVAAWDSIAHLTLMSLIAEEFGIDIDFEEFEDATSFAAVLDAVRAKAGNG